MENYAKTQRKLWRAEQKEILQSFPGTSVLKSVLFPVLECKDKGWERLFSNTILWAARAREQMLEYMTYIYVYIYDRNIDDIYKDDKR